MAAPPDPVATAQRLAPALPGNKFGLLRPFGTDRARDLTRGSGDALLASRVGQVVGSGGEFPWRPHLTANLDRVRNVMNDAALAEFARVYVGQALTAYVPQVLAVRVTPTRTLRFLQLAVTCTRVADADLKPPRTFSVAAALPL